MVASRRRCCSKSSTTRPRTSSGCLPCAPCGPRNSTVGCIPATSSSRPKLWNAKLSLAIKSLRFAIRHAPCSTASTRMTQVCLPSMPRLLLPNGVTRCYCRVNEEVSAEWVWPSHFAPKLGGFAKRWSMVSARKPVHESQEFLDLIREKRVCMYLHGGAYVVCGKGSHRGLVFNMAKNSDAIALSVGYRRIPEVDLEGVVDDAEAAFRFLLSLGVPPENIVFAGDSAGGALCVLLMMRLRDTGPLPRAAALISPWVDLDYAREWPVSPLAVKHDYIQLTAPVAHYAADLVAGKRERNDPMVSPLYADLSGLPPLLVQVGEYETLRCQIEAFAEKVKEADGNICMDIIPEMVHVPHIFATLSPAAGVAYDMLSSFIKDPNACCHRFSHIEHVDPIDVVGVIKVPTLSEFIESADVPCAFGADAEDVTGPPVSDISVRLVPAKTKVICDTEETTQGYLGDVKYKEVAESVNRHEMEEGATQANLGDVEYKEVAESVSRHETEEFGGEEAPHLGHVVYKGVAESANLYDLEYKVAAQSATFNDVIL